MKKIRTLDAVAIYLMALTVQMAFSLVLDSISSGDTYIYLAYTLPQVAYIGVLLIYKTTLRIPFGVIITKKSRIKPIAIIAVIAITIGVFMQNLFLAQLFAWLMEAIGVEMTVTLPALETAPQILLALLLIAVLPAIGEEAVFRGAFVNSIGEESGTFMAIVLSGAIFAFSHLNTAQLVHQFILGMLLAYIVIRSGNIIYAVIVHFLNNVMAIVIPIIAPSFNNLSVFSGAHFGILAAISVAGMCILYPTLRWFISITNGSQSWRGSGLISYMKLAWSEFDKTRKCHISLYILTFSLGAVCVLLTLLSLMQ
ncbi:MAG: type II CAAX endopeptidase family protein [Bacillota bacterium]